MRTLDAAGEKWVLQINIQVRSVFDKKKRPYGLQYDRIGNSLAWVVAL